MRIQKTSASSLASPKASRSKIIIRQAHLWEAPALGKIAAASYDIYPKTLSSWLNPYRHKYWGDYEGGFIERQWQRSFNPRILTFVAVDADAPNVPVGYVGFDRKGSDDGAKRLIASQDTYLLRILGWIFWIYYLIKSWVVGKSRANDPERLREFNAANAETETDYWASEGRQNRWHVLSMVVKKDWQKRGIGSMLMAEVIARSEEEGVIVGLEASEQGEPLYRRVGFELLARFKPIFAVMTDADPNVGGHFMYTPKKLRKEKA
ncbi:hypothetical protein D0Z07_2479 [Hyphodiscus hymeniophilus]|uniref:N-acetyltransferase domain-containing protein n=1 Tax=Hyphodiscus hymeniophilus TaxID=353542 RepID=A0A9P6VP87_9HELO|nr:hypothetical protein D0Z07_2479 [Hyphodiscus hymeniophilus]